MVDNRVLALLDNLVKPALELNGFKFIKSQHSSL